MFLYKGIRSLIALLAMAKGASIAFHWLARKVAAIAPDATEPHGIHRIDFARFMVKPIYGTLQLGVSGVTIHGEMARHGIRTFVVTCQEAQ